LDALEFLVEDDAFVDGFGAHDVLHASDDFEAVFVQLPGGGDGGEAEFIFNVVFQEESSSNVNKVELELVLQVQLHRLLKWQEILRHHFHGTAFLNY
jgi:hypothetical protein